MSKYLHLNPEIEGSRRPDGKMIYLVQIWYIPDEDIPCAGKPFIKGQWDASWTRRVEGEYIDVTNKIQCERLAGMKLQPIDKDTTQ